MIESIYLIKNGGTCFTSHTKTANPKKNDDLVSPFFEGLDLMINEMFDEKIRCFILDDGRIVYYKKIKSDNLDFKIVVVMSGKYNIQTVDQKTLQLKYFIMDKNWEEYLSMSSRGVPLTVKRMIEEKIESLFAKP